jgi:salicylate hydroxylase
MSPVHVFFTFVVPVAPLALWVDGLISCLRTRTPAEIQSLAENLPEKDGWTFSHGQKSVQWPLVTLYYFAGSRQDSNLT